MKYNKRFSNCYQIIFLFEGALHGGEGVWDRVSWWVWRNYHVKELACVFGGQIRFETFDIDNRVQPKHTHLDFLYFHHPTTYNFDALPNRAYRSNDVDVRCSIGSTPNINHAIINRRLIVGFINRVKTVKIRHPWTQKTQRRSCYHFVYQVNLWVAYFPRTSQNNNIIPANAEGLSWTTIS